MSWFRRTRWVKVPLEDLDSVLWVAGEIEDQSPEEEAAQIRLERIVEQARVVS